MIERVVLIKLKPAYAPEAKTVAEHTALVLREAPGVVEIRSGTGADPRTAKAWDVGLVIRFEDLEAVERYRAHPIHRKYVDVYLRPMLQQITVLNFGVEGGGAV